MSGSAVLLGGRTFALDFQMATADNFAMVSKVSLPHFPPSARGSRSYRIHAIIDPFPRSNRIFSVPLSMG